MELYERDDLLFLRAAYAVPPAFILVLRGDEIVVELVHLDTAFAAFHGRASLVLCIE
jgi:hypothetical protein